jgi:hypothetical protein
MAINCILPQQYDSYDELWDVEYEDERDDSEMYEEAGQRGYGGGHNGGNACCLAGGHKGLAGGHKGLAGGHKGLAGGISMMNTKAKELLEFKIIQDKDREIHPEVYKELKYKLREYFKLNVVIVKSKSAESHLRDDTYIDNLCNYSMLYNPRAHKMNKNKTGSASASNRKTQRQRARTV